MNELQELDRLIDRYPALSVARADILSARQMLLDCFDRGGKLLICGNGGSAADSEHIVGELMKEFIRKRPLKTEEREALLAADPSGYLAERLRGAFPAVSLVSQTSITTALLNDCDPAILYAQEVFGYGKPADVLLGLSTSGNAANVNYAILTARAKGMRSFVITGRDGGKAAKNADVAIHLPETETYRIQELTLPVYHALCILVEEHYYPEQGKSHDSGSYCR